MSTLSDLVHSHGRADDEDIDWLHLLVSELQLIADLAFADIVLWVPTNEGGFVAVSLSRPSSAATLFYRDFVGQEIKPEWLDLVSEAFSTSRIADSSAPDWYEETPTRVRAVPVQRRRVLGSQASDVQTSDAQASDAQARDAQARDARTRDAQARDDQVLDAQIPDGQGSDRQQPADQQPDAQPSAGPQPIAVLTRHTNLSEARTPSRQELTFNECANELFDMVAAGDFPDLVATTGPRRGAPRASDGLLQLDVDGYVTFASPNGLSAFNRMGFIGELEGESLAEVTLGMLEESADIDESLLLVVTGRAPWRTDIEARGVSISLRAIPVRRSGKRVGAIVLCRDVTELRHREQELLTKDATIREIHHRVKNNLQTVASLLRIQARRSHSEDARDSLNHAMRRVGAIAVVHDTLSEGLSQSVDFDAVFDRVLLLIAEVASSHQTRVNPKFSGSFGELPSTYATPLALALTELVTNAVEHGLAGRDGEVEIIANRTEDNLSVEVRDNGVGLGEGKVGTGLGTQIVRTLIQGELGGTIDWHTIMGSGTEVTIDVPLTWLTKA